MFRANVVILMGLSLGPVLISPCLGAEENKKTQNLMLENEHVKYVIGGDGKSLSFLDKHTGKEYCAAQPGRPFATLKKAGKEYGPSACAFTDGKIILQFQPPGIGVVIKSLAREHYFVFEVESASDPAVDELLLVNLPVTSWKYSSGISGVVADDDFAVSLRVLDLKADARIGGKPAVLAAICSQKRGVAGAKVALVGCPATEIRAVLREVIHNEGLPESPLGGPWSLDAPENRGSYVFAGVSEANVDQWIALAKKAGIAQVHFIGWERSYGHSEPRQDLFPRGVAGLKTTVETIHAAGLRAGMHTLTGCISPHDSWVAPVPDKRLAKDATLTLAATLDEKAQAVPTVEQPQEFDVVWAYSGSGNVIRIDDELIQYAALARESPYGFRRCKRGAFGTKPARHEKGAAVDHLYVRYQCFQPDENSTLVEELADAIARVFNTCGFDMIYMDGAEGMAGGWYGVARMREAIFRKLKGRVLVEASEWGYHSWPFHSRIGAWDYPNWGLKRFVDVHCRATEDYRRAALLPAQLGWWAILGPSRDQPAEFPDEIEYLCCKSLALDAPMSFQGIEPGRQPPNARQEEYLAMIGQYERLRLAGYFSAEVKQRLRTEKEEFRLVQAADGEWELLPTDYAAHKVTGLSDGTSTWTVENRYGAQPVKLRIEALYGAEPYDSSAALVLADFAKEGEFAANASARRVKHAIGLSLDQIKIGSSSGRYWAQNDGDSRQGAWCLATRSFTPEANLQKHEALGVWIHGDGKGELINFQLTNPPHYWPTYDEHYVRVDFKGWRYFELLLRERDADLYGDYSWPYGGDSAIYRDPLIRDHTSALNLYLNNLPPRGSVTCYLGSIKALPVKKLTLRNPAITINGKRIAFPVTLESGSYLDLASGMDCKIYDERGSLLRDLRLPSGLPTLAAGRNEVQFACEPSANSGVRAKITVISHGEPLRGRAAKAP